jgi:hypothetical protein
MLLGGILLVRLLLVVCCRLLLQKWLVMGVLGRLCLNISLVWMVLVRLHSSNTRGARTTARGRTSIEVRVDCQKVAVPQSTTWGTWQSFGSSHL